MVVTRSTLNTSIGYHETKYYKLTNQQENHHGYQYKTGLNVLDMPFQYEGDCVAGGLYFTTFDQIHNFISFGVWIREVRLPLDAKYVKVGNKYRADKIYLGNRYHINSVSSRIKYPQLYARRCHRCKSLMDGIKRGLDNYSLISGFNKRGRRIQNIICVLNNAFDYLTHNHTCQIYDKNKESNIKFRQVMVDKTKEFDKEILRSSDDIDDFALLKSSIHKCQNILQKF